MVLKECFNEQPVLPWKAIASYGTFGLLTNFGSQRVLQYSGRFNF